MQTTQPIVLQNWFARHGWCGRQDRCSFRGLITSSELSLKSAGFENLSGSCSGPGWKIWVLLATSWPSTPAQISIRRSLSGKNAHFVKLVRCKFYKVDHTGISSEGARDSVASQMNETLWIELETSQYRVPHPPARQDLSALSTKPWEWQLLVLLKEQQRSCSRQIRKSVA